MENIWMFFHIRYWLQDDFKVYIHWSYQLVYIDITIEQNSTKTGILTKCNTSHETDIPIVNIEIGIFYLLDPVRLNCSIKYVTFRHFLVNDTLENI